MYSCLKHKAHSYVVKGAGDFFPIDARPSTYSLDVAAGTGLVGEEVYRQVMSMRFMKIVKFY